MLRTSEEWPLPSLRRCLLLKAKKDWIIKWFLYGANYFETFTSWAVTIVAVKSNRKQMKKVWLYSGQVFFVGIIMKIEFFYIFNISKSLLLIFFLCKNVIISSQVIKARWQLAFGIKSSCFYPNLECLLFCIISLFLLLN